MRRRPKKIFRRERKEEFLINDRIRNLEVRLVGDDLETISKKVGTTITPDIYDTRKVKNWAREVELDLVMISPKANPPVCKIIDYKKFLYQKKKREKAIKANTVKTVIKEIRFTPNTDDHDFNFKVNHAKKFLEEGSKVKAFVHFRGRNIVFKDRGNLLLLRFLKEIEELGVTEALPRMEGNRRMFVIVQPKKKKK